MGFRLSGHALAGLALAFLANLLLHVPSESAECTGMGRRFCSGEAVTASEECPDLCKLKNCRGNPDVPIPQGGVYRYRDWNWIDLVQSGKYDHVYIDKGYICYGSCWYKPWESTCELRTTDSGESYCSAMDCSHDRYDDDSDGNRYLGCHKDREGNRKKPFHMPTCEECYLVFNAACGEELKRYASRARRSSGDDDVSSDSVDDDASSDSVDDDTSSDSVDDDASSDSVVDVPASDDDDKGAGADGREGLPWWLTRMVVERDDDNDKPDADADADSDDGDDDDDDDDDDTDEDDDDDDDGGDDDDDDSTDDADKTDDSDDDSGDDDDQSSDSTDDADKTDDSDDDSGDDDDQSSDSTDDADITVNAERNQEEAYFSAGDDLDYDVDSLEDTPASWQTLFSNEVQPSDDTIIPLVNIVFQVNESVKPIQTEELIAGVSGSTGVLPAQVVLLHSVAEDDMFPKADSHGLRTISVGVVSSDPEALHRSLNSPQSTPGDFLGAEARESYLEGSFSASMKYVSAAMVDQSVHGLAKSMSREEFQNAMEAKAVEEQEAGSHALIIGLCTAAAVAAVLLAAAAVVFVLKANKEGEGDPQPAGMGEKGEVPIGAAMKSAAVVSAMKEPAEMRESSIPAAEVTVTSV